MNGSGPRDAAENDWLGEVAYHRGDVWLKNRPKLFAIESTNYCNLKCIMCPRGEPDLMRRPLGHMSNDLLRRIVEETEFFSEPTWLHWFGEPLMNPNLFEQIRIAKRRVSNLGISTNGTLLKGENLRELLEAPLDTIMVAIDGDTKETYEQIRKSDRFEYERVRANIEEFLSLRQKREHKSRVILSIIDMNYTRPEFDSFRSHWTELGADEVLFKTYTNWAGQDPGVFDGLSEGIPQAGSRKHPCRSLWDSVVVAWDGRVVPCCYDYDVKMPLGDLNKQTLAEIWNGPAYIELRRAELEGRNQSALCANCTQAPGYARDPNFGQVSAL